MARDRIIKIDAENEAMTVLETRDLRAFVKLVMV
jgi:hypothetical protein